MRPQFRQILDQYSNLAAGRRLSRHNGTEVPDLIAQAQRRAADERANTVDVQEQIFALQARKQEIMRLLHADLRLLDASPNPSPQTRVHDAHLVGYDPHAQNLFYFGKGARHVPLTHGELLTDGAWNISYQLNRTLDRRCPVPRLLHKRYIVGETRRRLRALLHQQILLDESEASENYEGTRETYRRILHEPPSRRLPPGLLAEKMVCQFLQKLSYDHGLPFTIEPADPYADLHQKIDFLVRVKTRRSQSVIGIQLCVDTDRDRLDHKFNQVLRARRHLRSGDRIDDLRFVSLPLDASLIKSIFSAWQEAGKPPGGPEKLWSRDLKEYVFRRVLEQVFSSSPVFFNRLWLRVAPCL